MDPQFPDYLPLAQLGGLAASSEGLLWLAILLFLATSALMAAGIPGALNTMSLLGGMLLGLYLGTFVVLLGTVLGSQLLFMAARRWLGAPLNRRFGVRIEPVQAHLERRGWLYLVGARLSFMPHLVVTAACAATRMPAPIYLAASMIGMLPYIVITAMAGAALAQVAG